MVPRQSQSYRLCSGWRGRCHPEDSRMVPRQSQSYRLCSGWRRRCHPGDSRMVPRQSQSCAGLCTFMIAQVPLGCTLGDNHPFSRAHCQYHLYIRAVPNNQIFEYLIAGSNILLVFSGSTVSCVLILSFEYRIFEQNPNPNIRLPNYLKTHSPTIHVMIMQYIHIYITEWYFDWRFGSIITQSVWCYCIVSSTSSASTRTQITPIR